MLGLGGGDARITRGHDTKLRTEADCAASYLLVAFSISLLDGLKQCFPTPSAFIRILPSVCPMFRIDAAGEFSVAISSGQDSATREERRETVCDSVSDPRDDQMEDVVDCYGTVFSLIPIALLC
jgi:hypothetical protein